MSSSARFIAPMLLLRTDSLPDSAQWLYELKLDGYRAIAFKRDGVVHLRSRNDNDFSGRYPGVVKGFAKMPDNTRRSIYAAWRGYDDCRLSRTPA